MTRPPKPVPVDSNSLYICASPLTSNTKFHWSLIHVDHSGRATAHQWTSVDKHDMTGPEEYAMEVLSQGPMTRWAGTVILGYYKVSEYPVTTLEEFTNLCQCIFPESYETAQANRDHGITCRTWVLEILIGLGLSESRVKQIEDSVIARSTELGNEYLNAFLWRREFEAGRVFEV
ncbi:unnamed protein product [Somion occarium]